MPEQHRMRGLTHQHSQPIGDMLRAVLFTPVQERRLPFLIEHVIEVHMRVYQRSGDGRDLAVDTAGGGIDNKFELTIGKIVKRYRTHATGMCKQCRQRFCPGKGPVGNGHRTVQGKQRQQDSPRCAPRTNQQDPKSRFDKRESFQIA